MSDPAQPIPMGAVVAVFDVALPPSLDGRMGSNRSRSGGCQLAADTDIDAIRAWLAEYAGSPHTLRAYRKEVERLLVWSVRGQGKPLSSLTREDLLAYEAFLAQPGTDWIDGHPNDFLYVPPGGIHGFRNEADASVSLLMLFAPGAPREAYFEGFAHLADLSDEERAEWFIKNDNHSVE